MLDLNSIPYVPARDQWPRRTTAPHIWIVLHSIEAGEFERTAENCAAYFANPGNRVASTQFVVDVDSTIRCAEWENRVAGAVGANDEGWHIEQAGYAAQTEGEWSDTYSTRMILTQTAPLVAALAQRDGIPLEFVDSAGLLKRRPGVTTHHECWKAFGGDVRTDPGQFYPMERMLAAARRELAPPITNPRPPIQEDDDMLKAPRTSWRTEDNGEWFALNPQGDFVYINGGATLAALQSQHDGHPPEIAPPIPIQDRGVANTLAQFYNGERLDPEDDA